MSRLGWAASPTAATLGVTPRPKVLAAYMDFADRAAFWGHIVSMRRDGRVVDGGGLENHCTGNGAGGSNPSPSANIVFRRAVFASDQNSRGAFLARERAVCVSMEHLVFNTPHPETCAARPTLASEFTVLGVGSASSAACPVR
jgi:hypothetical protein